MLRIHETAIELVREVMPLIREIARSDPDLARQGRRAVMSCPLNIAEGSEQSGKRRAQHYRRRLDATEHDATLATPTKSLSYSFRVCVAPRPRVRAPAHIFVAAITTCGYGNTSGTRTIRT